MSQRLIRCRETSANEKLESMVIPTEFPTANPISQTDVDVQVNLLREYVQKFAELPEHQKLTELCSDGGFLKDIDKGQFFITLDEEGPDDMKYTLLRNQEASRARGGFVETRRSAQSWM